MSKSLNKVFLIGNVGDEPTARDTAGGVVAKFSLATNRTWNSGGQKQEKTEWHRITCFGKAADIVVSHVHKGDRLYVEGRLEYSQSTDGAGVVRYWTDIIVHDLVMLGGSKRDNAEDAPF
jgi:single-strand DNA-binding protein